MASVSSKLLGAALVVRLIELRCGPRCGQVDGAVVDVAGYETRGVHVMRFVTAPVVPSANVIVADDDRVRSVLADAVKFA